MSMENGINRCDLHTHTLASDGMQSPADNVRLASARGLVAVAITDHDTVSGVEEAVKAGEQYGIQVVPGVEISTRAGGKDIHVLGYFVDIHNAKFLERLESLRRTREGRNTRILEKLQELGLSVTMDDVIRVMNRPLDKDETIGRPHIADALVHKGYVKNMREAFDLYLAEGSRGSLVFLVYHLLKRWNGLERPAVSPFWRIQVCMGTTSW